MIEEGVVFFASISYIGLLFGVAYIGDRRADEGRSIISNPYIYTLSLAVYCTAWTYYGSVGRAAGSGPGFLPVYIGPTLVATLGWVLLRKIIRISKIHRITSIADFIASRYGKSTVVGGVVTVMAVIGIIPYIALQLKAVSVSFLIVREYPNLVKPGYFTTVPIFHDTSFYAALLLALFAIIFGTRHLEATERHEGLVAAIAFESLVKLIAFTAVGIFVVYSIHDGFADLMTEFRKTPKIQSLLELGHAPGTYADWGISIFLSMLAFLLLPRQFHIAVVENVDEDHLNRAVWLFPLYLLAINIFVLPIAGAGLLRFSGMGIEADTFVLTLPISEKQGIITLLVYIGGMSAATGMVIVETVALSTMISNDLVMPVLLRLPFLRLLHRGELKGLLLFIRRASIILVLLCAYTYFRFIGEFYELVSIGLVSFTAVAQFGPSLIGGIFWKGGNRKGALCGLISGFLIWGYTLVIPSMAQTGLIPEHIITHGPWDIGWLKPYTLFGLTDFNPISHAVFWSLLVNLSAYIGVSLFTRTDTLEHTQATLFVDVFRYSEDTSPLWRGTASVPDLHSLLERFLGSARAEEAFSLYAQRHPDAGHPLEAGDERTADSGLVDYAEKLLAGVIGSASARVMVASVVKEEPLGMAEVMHILDETRQVIAYSRELERTTDELVAANERLKELDRLKDDFISTVTHELRTPLTSVRALAEILHDTPDIDLSQKEEFTEIIIKETDRLTRLITQVLDIQKIESGRIEWQITDVNLNSVVKDAVLTTRQLIGEKKLHLDVNLSETIPIIKGDQDRLIQVMVNLISNAVKFCDPGGKIEIRTEMKPQSIGVSIIDDGIGISTENQKIIFEKFQQIKEAGRGRPPGSGLGLAITKRIIDFHRGTVQVRSRPDEGSTFTFFLPLPAQTPPDNEKPEAT